MTTPCGPAQARPADAIGRKAPRGVAAVGSTSSHDGAARRTALTPRTYWPPGRRGAGAEQLLIRARAAAVVHRTPRAEGGARTLSATCDPTCVCGLFSAGAVRWSANPCAYTVQMRRDDRNVEPETSRQSQCPPPSPGDRAQGRPSLATDFSTVNPRRRLPTPSARQRARRAAGGDCSPAGDPRIGVSPKWLPVRAASVETAGRSRRGDQVPLGDKMKDLVKVHGAAFAGLYR